MRQHTKTSHVKNPVLGLALFFSALLFLLADAHAQDAHQTASLDWLRNPPKSLVQYDYVMTARVRLLFFWAGKDDVGGGYVRRGISAQDPTEEMFQVLFGSDPAKAPRAINRWGAGTEAVWHQNALETHPDSDAVSSAFFGFMKPSRGKSASEMQGELKKEKEQGTYLFTGIMSRVDSTGATSLIVPLQSQIDYNLHQYDQALPVMLDRIAASDRPGKTLPASSGGCIRGAEFLGTISALLHAALEGRKAPFSLCYLYDAEEDSLSVERTETLARLPVQLHGAKGVTILATEYQNILQLDFLNTNKTTGRKVYFTILVGTQGPLRGVPVQIRYQPNWWFQILLNLRSLPAPPLAAREMTTP